MKKATLIALLLMSGACRRKHAPVEVPEVERAPPAEIAAPEIVMPHEDPLPPPAPPRGHSPTDAEVRAAIAPLFNDVARCVSQAGPVTAQEKYLQLRFTISPAGSLISAELEGHDAARGCVNEVLRALHFPPWVGAPDIVIMPLTHEGRPVPVEAFTSDAGAK